MKKMLLIYNPFSGKEQFKTKLAEIVEFYTQNNYITTVRPTKCKGDATHIIMKEAMGYDLVVVSGGDGTLNEIVNGLIRLPESISIGYIPSGTTNDFSSSLQLSKDIMTSAQTVTDGKQFTCDIGTFNDTTFTYTAAFGLFTDVSYQTSQDMKHIFGKLAYFLEGVKRISHIPSYDITLTTNDQMITDEFIFGMVTNSTSIGGFKMVRDDAIELDDGLFEVVLVKKPQTRNEIQSLIQCLLTRTPTPEHFYMFKAKEIELYSKVRIDWTLDGEFGGATDSVFIRNHKQFLHIMVDSDFIQTYSEVIEENI